MPITRKEDLYDDEPDDQQSRLTEGGEKDEAATTVGLLSKSILRGREVTPGDKLTVVIKAIYDDQIAVEYPTGEGEAATEEPPPDAEKAEATMPNPVMAEGEPGGMYE